MATRLRNGFGGAIAPGKTQLFKFGLSTTLIALSSVMVAHFSARSARTDSLRTKAALPALASGGTERAFAAKPPATGATRVLRFDQNIEIISGNVARKYRISRTVVREFIDTAYRESKRNRLDPLLIIAVMAVESGFNPVAQSVVGATGLMQVIPRFHADKFTPSSGESVLDPRINIRVGVQALKEYILRGGTEAAGLQLYNGASGDSSNAYSNRVLAERERLQGIIGRTS